MIIVTCVQYNVSTSSKTVLVHSNEAFYYLHNLLTTCRNSEVTWLTSEVKSGRIGPHGEDPIPDLSESSDYNAVMIRRIELKETIEKLPKIILGVYLVLQYHLEHGVPKIQIRVVGILLHRHTFAAHSAEPSDGPGGIHVVVRVRKLWGVDVGRECCGGGGSRGGGRVVLAWRRKVVKFAFLERRFLGFWLRVVYVRKLWSYAAAAAKFDGNRA